VGIEHGVEALPVGAAGQPVEAAPEPADPARLDEGEEDEDEDDEPEADDRRSDVRRDGGIQVDRSVLRSGWGRRAARV